MSDEPQPTRMASSQADDLSRRQWLLRLGEMVVLAGVSGLVQNPRRLCWEQDKARHEPLPLCRPASTTLRPNIWFTR